MEARPADSCPTPLLEGGSDLALRSQRFVLESLRHSAKVHLGLLRWLLTRSIQQVLRSSLMLSFPQKKSMDITTLLWL
jgi:hypothetical protein